MVLFTMLWHILLLDLCGLAVFSLALPQTLTQISDGQVQAQTSTANGPSATAGVAASAPTAVTKNGTYQGFHLSSYSQDVFLGIPYAQPPLDFLRLRVPQSLNSTFSGVRSATEYYPECVGYGGDDIGYEQSEDCLALNVIRPAGYEGQQLPVAVWLHGGGLVMGGTSDKRYNLSFIVQNSVEIDKPIIGVSIGYRLAAWGFLSSLQVQGSGNTNLGLRDQRLGLHWIQENIAAFGGDPSKVTIWGESAGAISVGYHLIAYGGRDDKIFRAGIMESGNPITTVFSDAYYQPLYDRIINETGCSDQIDTLNCLRSVPYDQLNAVFNSTGFNGTEGDFQPVIDGDFVQKFGSLQLAAGEYVHVPIIDGANSDEGTAFGPRGIENATQFAQYLESPDIVYAGTVPLPSYLVNEILAAYPDDPAVGIPGTFGDERLNASYGYEYRRTSAYTGDQVFIANRRLTCATWASANVPAYCYRFNTRPNGLTPEIGVTHFQEVAFVFNNIDGLGYNPDPFAGEPQSYFALSKLMSCSWASFVHDLDPNSFRTSAVGAQIAGNASLWPNYIDGPMDIVWDANVSSYAEPDTYRAAGIDLINQASLVYQR